MKKTEEAYLNLFALKSFGASTPQHLQKPRTGYTNYFRTNYWFNLTDQTFVKVESEQPNEYADYDPLTKTWNWDASLILADIRRERDGKLGRSDWTQLSDTNLTADQKAEAVDYRRALRDITINIGSPVTADAVDWPTPPSFLD